MANKDAIQQEIKRKQDKLDIYMNAGKLSEAQRISQDIQSLLNQLRS